jgi:ribosomal protein S3
MKHLIRTINKKLSALIKDKNDSKVKHTIKTYFDGFYIENLIDMAPAVKGPTTKDLQIHKIKVKTLTNKITIEISLERPGLLIGKKGYTIDELKTHLEKIFETKIFIHIKEINPFN